MSKFKVGDEVVVLCKFEERGNGINWHDDMYKTIGMAGHVIPREGLCSDRCRVLFPDGSEWTYLDRVLTLADNAEKEAPASVTYPKISLERVGDTCKLVIEGSLSRDEIERIVDIVYGN